MEAFNGVPSLWDLSQQPVSFSQLPDDDFLALLQKQFVSNDSPTANSLFSLSPGVNGLDGVDPQSLTRYNGNNGSGSPSSSDESSPSPPSVHTDTSSRRQSAAYSGSQVESAHGELKRKASGEDVEDGPSRKTAHPNDTAGAKKGTSSRRKSTGNPHQDESRLLKRKEQNRAAQRAFRERKEKHVRDLEDKVAALEAKNAVTQSENENLRDLLQRLQSENMQLKQAAFTFNMPSTSTASPSSAAGPSSPPFTAKPNTQPLYAALRDYTFNFSSPPSATVPHAAPVLVPETIDFNALTTFDAAALSEQPDVHMDMGYDGGGGRSPYRTIASNPLFMSFAEPAPEYEQPQQQQGQQSYPTFASPASTGPGSGSTGQTFEFNQFLPWPGSIPSPSYASGAANSHSSNGNSNGQQQQQQQQQHNGNNGDSTMQSFDDLFGGNFLTSTGTVDFNALVARSPGDTMSPVSHHASGSPSSLSSGTEQTPSSSSSSSSSPLTPTLSCSNIGGPKECPKTKAELGKCIEAQGASPFVTGNGGTPVQPFPVLRKAQGGDGGEEMVVCKGSNIPRTEASERNVEVLAAWRSITSDPKFKDIDINELCSEFTKKAKCDGTKVVLEPAGVQCILDRLQAKKQGVQH